jgi:hypothetical protein
MKMKNILAGVLATILAISSPVYAADTVVVGAGEAVSGEDITPNSILVGAGSAADPSVAIGAVDTGLYSAGASNLDVTISGVVKAAWIGDQFIGATGGGWGLQNEVSSATNPVHVFSTDDTSGLGGMAGSYVSIIVNSIEGARVTESGGDTLNTFKSNAANTAPIAAFDNLSGDIQIFRVDASPEGSITGSRGDIAVGINGNSEGALFIKHTGDASNTGWKSVTLSHEGNMHIHDNTVDTVIYTGDTLHYIFGLFSSVVEEGYTFSAGFDGVVASFSDYSSTVPGAVLATDVSHGLSTDQGITINNSADYNAAFNVTVVNSDTFYFMDTFVGDETASWQKGDCLKADTGAAGRYNVFMAGFGLGTTGGTDAFEWETTRHTPGSDPVPIENAEVKETFTGSTNPTSFTGIGSVTVADGDELCLAMIGLTGTDDFENSHISFIVRN